jgi:adenylate cyclase class 2
MESPPTEIEAKFAVGHLEPIRRTLKRLAARQTRPRLQETNIRFDVPDGRLAQAGQVLRLRKNHETRLTFKAPGPDFEHRHEIEVGLEDAAAAQQLLESLGFQPVFVYEKYRETFALPEAEVMLDELPFGVFVEIEGRDLAHVRRAADRLGFVWDDRLAFSYLGLFERLRLRHAWPFRDATFANFAGFSALSPAELRSTLEER